MQVCLAPDISVSGIAADPLQDELLDEAGKKERERLYLRRDIICRANNVSEHLSRVVED